MFENMPQLALTTHKDQGRTVLLLQRITLSMGPLIFTLFICCTLGAGKIISSCPNSHVVRANCGVGYHIVLDSVTLIKKEHMCGEGSCCKEDSTDTQLATFNLPSDNKNVTDTFRLAIRSCSFERNSCFIPTRSELFTTSVLTSETVDMVIYRYKCVPESTVRSVCDVNPATGVSVSIFHDGPASGNTVGCQCRVTATGQAKLFKVHIVYMKNTECSLNIHDEVCEMQIRCDDSSVLLGGTDMTYNEDITLTVNSTPNNYITVEISSATRSPVSVSCGGRLSTNNIRSCPVTPATTTIPTSTSKTSHQTVPSSAVPTAKPSTGTSISTITSSTAGVTTGVTTGVAGAQSTTTQGHSEMSSAPSGNLDGNSNIGVIVGSVTGSVVFIGCSTVFLILFLKTIKKAKVSPTVSDSKDVSETPQRSHEETEQQWKIRP